MNHSPDIQIDKILHGLNNIEAPIGIERRISARMEQFSHARVNRTSTASLLDFLKLPPIPAAAYPVAIAALVVLAVTTFISHREPHTIALNQPALVTISTPYPHTYTAGEARPQTKVASQKHPVLESTSLTQSSSSAEADPEAIALAETFAPSHPAPPLPLTAQEALLLRSARPGQPIEVAELEMRRESVLNHIAEVHERTSIREYIHGLLGPLATAEAITPSPTPPEDTQPVPQSEPLTSQ